MAQYIHHHDPANVAPPECYECGADMEPEPGDECELICDECGHHENVEPDFS